MIKAIKDRFTKILDDMDEERAASNLNFRHEIKIHTKEIYNVWCNRIRTIEKERGISLGLNDKDVKIALGPCVHKVFKRTNIHKILRREVAYGLNKEGEAGTLIVSDGPEGGYLTIELVTGAYYQKTRKGTKEGKAKRPYRFNEKQGVIQYLFKELYYEMGDEINKTKAFEKIAQDSASQLLPNFATKGDIMAHGDLDPMQGVDQPTIANIALKRGAPKSDDLKDDLQRDFFADVTSHDADKETKMLAKAASQMVDTYVDSLEREYKINDNIDYDEMDINRKFIVRGHYTDRTGNKNPAMAHYDKGRFSKNGGGILGHMYSLDQKLKNKFLDEAKHNTEEYAKLEGSPSYRKAQDRLAKKVAILGLVGAVQQTARKSPDLRLKVNKKLLQEAKDVKRKSRKKTNVKRTGKSKKSTGKRVAAQGIVVGKGVSAARGKGKVDSAAGSNPLALKNLLNEVLPQEVAKRMQSPALNYRTGRFANSAEVTEVLMGPRGGLQSIDYTYRRNPYETFEPGGKQGSIQRDPRKLIGGTIRELAQGIIGRKMIPTRRV
jgi:hypothetical protein